MTTPSEKYDGKFPLYVVGFLFRENQTQVALIEKTRPEWQKGSLNGIGGKVMVGESSEEAMRREFLEEAGVDIRSWRFFCHLKGTDSNNPWSVMMFTSDEPGDIKTMEDEQVGWYSTVQIVSFGKIRVIPNLRRLIPMAIAERPTVAFVEES